MAETTPQSGAVPPGGDLITSFRAGGRKRTGKPGKGAPRGAASRRSGSFASRVGRHFLDVGSVYAGRLLSNVQIDMIRARLLRAGFPYGLKATQFAFLKWLLMVCVSFVFAAAVPILAGILSFEVAGPGILMVFLVGAIYGFKLPDFWLTLRIRNRQNDIQMALPDMIDLITVSVEAGLGLGAAIARVAQRFPNSLSEEFVRTMQEIHLGRSQAESLRDMAKRLDVPDLTTFLTSLVQAETLGLPIANVLRVQSERLREKRSQRAREQAQKAPIKMIFPLVFFIFPAIFVVILGPAALKIAESGF